MSFRTLRGREIAGARVRNLMRYAGLHDLKQGVEDFSSPANAQTFPWFVRNDIVFQLIIKSLKMCTHSKSLEKGTCLFRADFY